ncbi:hypothetical protein E2C01_000401 [Portunus trituberculatus]|uniref:Uncharacterized protein n=1 Tax=Portunus trituberculatus TaxID=210409 RepID=A0A5B7CEU7_PORTR|nr:hypothetical protein [Portunus trituberculatus]
MLLSSLPHCNLSILPAILMIHLPHCVPSIHPVTLTFIVHLPHCNLSIHPATLMPLFLSFTASLYAHLHSITHALTGRDRMEKENNKNMEKKNKRNKENVKRKLRKKRLSCLQQESAVVCWLKTIFSRCNLGLTYHLNKWSPCHNELPSASITYYVFSVEQLHPSLTCWRRAQHHTTTPSTSERNPHKARRDTWNDKSLRGARLAPRMLLAAASLGRALQAPSRPLSSPSPTTRRHSSAITRPRSRRDNEPRSRRDPGLSSGRDLH